MSPLKVCRTVENRERVNALVERIPRFEGVRNWLHPSRVPSKPEQLVPASPPDQACRHRECFRKQSPGQPPDNLQSQPLEVVGLTTGAARLLRKYPMAWPFKYPIRARSDNRKQNGSSTIGLVLNVPGKWPRRLVCSTRRG